MRQIPVPATLSDAAKAFLRQPPPQFQRPTNPQAWKAYAVLINKVMVDVLGPAVAAQPVTLEAGEINGTPVFTATPEGARPGAVVLYVHGGSFVLGSGRAAGLHGALEAVRNRATVWAVDFRVPPEHPYPAGMDDCVAVYRGLLETHAPGAIMVLGASSGASLAVGAVLKALDEGLPQPGGVALLSPLLDLTEGGDTFRSLQGLDRNLQEGTAACNALYAGRHDPKGPYLSPVFAEFPKGFPPTLITSGTRDLFLSNAVVFHRKLRRQGVYADLNVWEAAPHGGFNGGAPEDSELYWEVKRFFDRCWNAVIPVAPPPR